MWRRSPAWSTRRRRRLYIGGRRSLSWGMADPVTPQAARGEALQPVFRDAVLEPHRSLKPAGFVAIMAVFGGISVVAGTLFVLHGAWPVMGFFGLDVGLVYLAFRINYRSARRQERIRLVADALTVERRGGRGEPWARRLQPHWLRGTLEEWDDDGHP